MTPTVTTNVLSGASPVSAEPINFGTVPPTTKSSVFVVSADFSGVNTVGEVGIGVASSNIPGGPAGVLFFDVFDSLEDVVEPTRTFAGESGDDGSSNVEEVGLRLPKSSKYVALMLKAQDKPLDCGCVVMRWFFGFDLEV